MNTRADATLAAMSHAASSAGCPGGGSVSLAGSRCTGSRGCAALLPLLLSLVFATACGGPKLIREPVFSSDSARIQLRRTLVKGKPVPRGYAQPATISDVRLAHVLATIEHEDKDG